MASTSIKVREIHCESCEHTIRTALGALAGVRAVVASAQRGDVRVSFDEATVSEQRLRETLSEVGYEPIS